MLLAAIQGSDLAAQVNAYNNFTIVTNNLTMIKINTTPAPVSMTLSTAVAGSSVTPVSNSNSYLKVTSISPAVESRKITAIIYTGNVALGTLLKLVATPCTNIGSAGDRGTVVTPAVTLNKTANQTIIQSIGSCYTGTGSTDGYNLTYTWQPDASNYYRINANAGATTIVISFTIMSE